MLKRILILVALIAVVAGVAIVMMRRPTGPSVVLIVIDTLRADKLGVYGSGAPASSELDTLANEGVIFERAISQASWTRSSMASMLTGMFPREVNVVKERWDPLPKEATTLAEALSENGYQTIGLTANPQLNRDFNFEQGFDTYIESTVIFSWMKPEEGKTKASGKTTVRRADDMLREAKRLVQESSSSPFYLQLLLMDVHAHHRIAPEEVDADLRDHKDAAYLQSVRNATRPVAAFMKELKEMREEEIIFVITADHGEGLEDHPSVKGSKGHGNLLYRSQVHVPLIFTGTPEILGQARRVPNTVRLLDLVPTILDLVGASALPNVSGESLGVNTQKAIPSRPAFTETQWRRDVRKVAVINDEWLYVENRDEWPGTDPRELHPFLAAQDGSATNQAATNAGVTERLGRTVKELIKKMKDRPVEP